MNQRRTQGTQRGEKGVGLGRLGTPLESNVEKSEVRTFRPVSLPAGVLPLSPCL